MKTMNMASFFDTYFVAPLLAGDAPYNTYNTIVYAVVFALAVGWVYKLLQKLDVKIDRDFFIATLPYILLATVLRVLRDAGKLTSPAFVSPLIYLLLFLVTFGALLLGLFVEKKKLTSYRNFMLGVGIVLLLVSGSMLEVAAMTPVMQIFFVTVIVSVFAYLVYVFRPDLLSGMNFFILTAAVFDAASTFVGVEFYGYVEKHVVPNFFFGIAGGPWIMLPLKLAVVFLALYAIDHIEEDTFFKNFVKFAILCVTLGPGARNTLRMMMGV